MPSVFARVAPAALIPAALIPAALFLAAPVPVAAHDPAQPEDHAPIGVMGDHLHDAGEVMLSYRFAHMSMSGNRIGTRSVTPETIATTAGNRFADRPGQPPTLRVVPTDMTMDMHMLGAMVGVTDDLTLMAMGMVMEKDMDHITFAGGMGTDRLGGFTTASADIGDTGLTALYRLAGGDRWQLHLNAGISLPTGPTGERDSILTPMGMRPTVRLPYAMQIGTGTVDLLPGLTLTGTDGRLSYGGQLTGRVHLGSNGKGYSFGDRLAATVWAARGVTDWLALTARLAGETTGAIDGIDPAIVAPVQTADPARYGGDRLDGLLGVNLIVPRGPLAGNRLSVEAGLPLVQDLKGPQMETDWTLTLGWQLAF